MRGNPVAGVLIVLGALAGLGVALSSGNGAPPAAGDIDESPAPQEHGIAQDWYWTPAAPAAPNGDSSALGPTPTWEKYCHLGPPPGEWESWEAFIEYGRGIIEKYGPPPTPEPVPFDEAVFEGRPPSGYSSWQEFARDVEAIGDEVEASGASARAACTGEQVCVETSFGPVCVAPPGEPAWFCAGGDCPTPELRLP
jgi:hypothetical protein